VQIKFGIKKIISTTNDLTLLTTSLLTQINIDKYNFNFQFLMKKMQNVKIIFLSYPFNLNYFLILHCHFAF